MKKVISLLVTALMLLQLCICVSAEDIVSVSISGATVDAGGNVDVTIDLASNPGILGMTLKLAYPKEFKYVKGVKGEALSTLTFLASGSAMADEEKPNMSYIKLTWDGLSEVDTKNGTIATVTFEVPENMINGDYEFELSYVGDVYDADIKPLKTNVVDDGICKVTVENGMEHPALSISNINAKSGSLIDVDINLTNNPGLLGMNLKLDYPSEFKYEKTTQGKALSSLNFTCGNPVDNSIGFVWDGVADADTTSGTLVTITFSIPAETKSGEYVIGDNIEINAYDGNPKEVSITLVNDGKGIVSVTHEHTYTSEVTKSASCTESGVITYSCSCGDSYTEEIKALGHDWGEAVITKEATCTEDGEMTASCKREGCDVKNTPVVIPAGHKWDEGKITTEATCIAPGEKTYTCAACGETKTEAIDKTAHTYDSATTIPATCTEAGKIITTCTVCGNEVNEVIPATGHDWGKWEVVKEADSENKGSEKRTCSVCGDEETREIPATGDKDDTDFDYSKIEYIMNNIRYYTMNKSNFTYSVRISSNDGGEIDGASSVKYGKDAVYTITPDEGYEIASVKVNGVEVGAVEKVYLKNVRANSRIEVKFAEIVEEVIELAEDIWVNPFVDVADNYIYIDAIKYVCENGLMNGTGNGKFSPETSTERAMIVTILWRLEGSPIVSAEAFDDVAEGTWYSDAVAWASLNGIVNGYGDGTFGPANAITHEQLAAILYRYAGYKGYDVSAGADDTIPEGLNVSGWAVDAMIWANAAGLLDKVALYDYVPGSDALRGEAADVLMRFCEFIS